MMVIKNPLVYNLYWLYNKNDATATDGEASLLIFVWKFGPLHMLVSPCVFRPHLLFHMSRGQNNKWNQVYESHGGRLYYGTLVINAMVFIV